MILIFSSRSSHAGQEEEEGRSLVPSLWIISSQTPLRDIKGERGEDKDKRRIKEFDDGFDDGFEERNKEM